MILWDGTQSLNETNIRSHHAQTPSLLLRVCRLPYASQFVRLHCSTTGQLQQSLDIEEDGGLVVGQRKLHLPGRTETGHLRVSKHEDKLVEVKFFGQHVLLSSSDNSHLTFRVRER